MTSTTAQLQSPRWQLALFGRACRKLASAFPSCESGRLKMGMVKTQDKPKRSQLAGLRQVLRPSRRPACSMGAEEARDMDLDSLGSLGSLSPLSGRPWALGARMRLICMSYLVRLRASFVRRDATATWPSGICDQCLLPIAVVSKSRL